MTGTMVEVATTCTTINEQKTYAELPPGTKGYLQEKIEYALKAPDIVNVRLPDGSTTVALLKQIVMAAAIRVDEALAGFQWQYKAEVCFDMWPNYISKGEMAPIPFLSSTIGDGPGRRHSLNPFPAGRRVGYVRRPDVIIVKNSADRWPGRSLIDHQGNPHVDNSLRLVEIKFPGDEWGNGQERAYRRIAGKPGEYMYRMTVIDVSDCNGDLERIREQVLAMSYSEREAEIRRRRQERRLRAPIRTIEPIAEPAWYEEWIARTIQLSEEFDAAVAPIWNIARDSISHVSAEARAWLESHAPWILTEGEWVENAASSTWRWVDKAGQEIYRYTTAQLKAGWDEIVKATDITWKQFTQIDWTQIGTSIIKGLVIVVALVAGTVTLFVLAEMLLAILLVLVAIVATASAGAIAALAVALGVSVAPGIATAS